LLKRYGLSTDDFSWNMDRWFDITISHMLKVINFRLCRNVLSA